MRETHTQTLQEEDTGIGCSNKGIEMIKGRQKDRVKKKEAKGEQKTRDRWAETLLFFYFYFFSPTPLLFFTFFHQIYFFFFFFFLLFLHQLHYSLLSSYSFLLTEGHNIEESRHDVHAATG